MLPDQDPDWLTHLDSHPHTLGYVYFQTPIPDLVPLMHTTVYNWSAVNCDMLKSNSISRSQFWDRTYGQHCFDNIADTWQGGRLRPDDMMRGMPIDYQHPKNKVTLTHIHVLSDAIVNMDGDVFVDDLKIVGHRCPARFTRQKYSAKFPPISKQAKAIIYDEVFTMSQFWGTGYFHFLVETLPRITPFIQFLRDNPTIKVHVFGKDKPYIKPFFAQMGITGDRFVVGLIRARVLYLPQTGPCAGALVFNGRLQSMIQRSSITQEPQPRNSIVLIKRSKKRYFNKHNEILASLRDTLASTDCNYRVEVFDDNPLPTLNETMAMFNRAFMVVAPHGAGEANLLFSEPGTIVVEGLCKPPNLCYRNHMQSLGHRYYGVYRKDRDCFTLDQSDILKPVKKYLEIIKNTKLSG